MKIVFVAFDCKKDKSVMYKKVEILDTSIFNGELEQGLAILMGFQLLKAIRKGADFCSVRFIRNEKND